MILDYPDGPQIQFTSVLMKEEQTQTLREWRKPREDGNSAASYSAAEESLIPRSWKRPGMDSVLESSEGQGPC